MAAELEFFFQEAAAKKSNTAFAKGWQKLALKKNEEKDRQAAIAALHHALALNPTLETSWQLLGLLSGYDSRPEVAEEACRPAVSLRTDWELGIRYLSITRHLLYSYRDAAEVEECYQRFKADLLDFYSDFQNFSTEKKKSLYSWLLTTNTFLLPYLGKETRNLQQCYGTILHEVLTSVFPEGKERPPLPPVDPNRRLRIGILSEHFWEHTVWKLMLHGWLKHLNKEEFELYVYSVSDRNNSCTEIAKTYAYKFVQGNHPPDWWLKQIRSDRLHLILFPEIGMSFTVLMLAALRLAPIQCMSWGHPDTSGLPTIDYFLSSELMEPTDGENHYTEKLVQLKNLGIFFSPLPQDPRPPITREEFGLKKNAVIYGCLQSVFKYLPQFDTIYPEIAALVPNCQFIFLTTMMSKNTRRRFEARLEQSFAEKNLDYRDYCFFSRPLNFYGFTSMLHCLDVFLDSIEWSGGNSTLEALYYAQLPIVTTPGRFMRGRHTAGILTLLEIPELIAPDIPAYIQKAAELGQNPEYRQYIRQKVHQNLPKVFADQAGIRSLEDFIRTTVREFAASKCSPDQFWTQ
ncbi:MAG: hypothetical protein P3X23_011420 [Thermosynechococcus sp. Uc]|uniref:O-linked N-acetylglucosamine transferase, SPINDLY family protein n=1 Tax=Thermosynechococcus sp. Uc TaxID=3034853 RepID=UPI00259F2998|nr:hypothetical protein [Thermosynechococcus sp. Uc]MDM7327701.1 hypothetical protein [Thermosynechococcus sp. Uc]